MKPTITIVCVGGWKYTGQQLQVTTSFFGKLLWIKLETKKGTIDINGDHVIAKINYAD